MRYWFTVIEIVIGERSFFSKSVQQTSEEEFDLNEYAKDFYGMTSREVDEGVYEYDNGSIIVSAYRCEEISKYHYEVLRRFL